MRITACLLLSLVLVSAPGSSQAAEPSNEELIRKADALRADHEYRASEKMLRRVLARDPEHLEASLKLAAGVLEVVGEGRAAIAIARRMVQVHPDRPAPYRVVGMLMLGASGPEQARPWFKKALARRTNDVGSLRGLAWAAMLDGEMDEAGRQLDRVEAIAPDAVDVILTRALWLHRTRKLDAAARAYARALELSPWNLTANAAAAGGKVLKGGPVYRPPWTPIPYRRKIKKALRLYHERRFEAAESSFARLDTDEAFDGRPAFYRGIVALRSGKTRPAMEHLKRAVVREPDNFLFRNAFVRSVGVHIAHQRVEYGGGADETDRIEPLAARIYRFAEIPGVDKFVRGYDELLPRERQVVLRAVTPFRKYLDGLIERGVTHDILGLDERVADAPERKEYRTGQTKYGSWTPATRGIGGRHAATGLEYLVEAAELRTDAFAHELAHQIHKFALPEEQVFEIKQLYLEAVEHGRYLRPYAGLNEFEYFAVAYAAFVSVVKSPWQLDHHDRAALRAKDPRLYAFFLKITGIPHPDPAIAPLEEAVLTFYEWAGHEQQLARARELFATEDATR